MKGKEREIIIFTALLSPVRVHNRFSQDTESSWQFLKVDSQSASQVGNVTIKFIIQNNWLVFRVPNKTSDGNTGFEKPIVDPMLLPVLGVMNNFLDLTDCFKQD